MIGETQQRCWEGGKWLLGLVIGGQICGDPSGHGWVVENGVKLTIPANASDCCTGSLGLVGH